jgi:uncharacterized protein (DUF362 family)
LTLQLDHTQQPTVAVTRVANYNSANISRALAANIDLLGGLDKFVNKGDSVLIKPNFITARPPQAAAQTDPAVIIALAKLLKDFGAKPFVGDSPAWGNIHSCVEALGLTEPLHKLDVPVKPLDKPKRLRIDGSTFHISQLALEADKIINLHKFKAHQQLGATFAVKNMFGCVCGKTKAWWHFSRGRSHKDFCTMLIEIYKLMAPAFSVIDGVVAMEGQGPISGTPKPLGFLIGGVDPIACEMVCCDLIQMDPANLPIIQTAKSKGFGCSDLSQINILGDDYRKYIATDFLFAEQAPLEFTLPRICKSICKQIMLQIKSKLSVNSR